MTLTEAEILVGPRRRGDSSGIRTASELLSESLTVVAVSRPIAQEAAGLRADFGLSLADAIIVATALAEGCSSLLGNDRRFRRLEKRLTYVHLDDLVA